MTEQTVPYQVKQPAKPRTLFAISDDLEKLSELLDECDDVQQRELIDSWFEQLGAERDSKLDNYCALIAEMLARAEARKVEAKRLLKLASTDENRAKLLEGRLKWFFETHNVKTLDTARYRLSLAGNGGKAPLILKDGVSPTGLPERFQKLSIDLDTSAIREALERGEELDFAVLGERGASLRIK
jgi:Mor family transcriptional regulator